jgi:hypothetical protein
MKSLTASIAALAAIMAFPVLGADVGLSISIGQPGFYGQIDLGNSGRPPVIYERPVVIERVPRGMAREPLYLRVPPVQTRNWRRYCSTYNACGRPVYFVRDDWYNRVYAPRYRAEHRDDRREERRDDRRDDRGENRGHGNN